jgi:hypothetical protein
MFIQTRQREAFLVLFVLTRRGLDEWLDLAGNGTVALWLNHGLLEDSELAALRARGLKLTDFANWHDPADESKIRDALETIREHHPGETLYVERP